MKIKDGNGNLLAIIIRSDYDKEGITFFTEDDFSQQLAYMHHPEGHIILPHVHNVVKREVHYTKETIIVKKGKLRCDFYSDDQMYISSVTAESGDIILLVSGGHGFVCLEETRFYEVKQGPYAGNNDKTRFEPYDGEIVWAEEYGDH